MRKSIYLVKRFCLLSCTLFSLMASASNVEKNDSAQVFPYVLTGQVVNASTHQGFTGASVTSSNLRVSAMTDESGTFTLRLPSLEVTIQVEAPGFQRQIVSVQGRSEITIQLIAGKGANYYENDVLGVGEAHVDWSAKGSSNAINDLTILTGGQMRGISRSGEPGNGASFFIRGFNSLSASSQPLFVVDGVVWQMQEEATSVLDNYQNNPLTLLDPADIESISILKNGSAVWGAKGANGVVLITMKRGKEMATKIDASLSAGIQLPVSSMPMMGADAYRLYATDVMRGIAPEITSKYQFTNDDPTKSYYAGTHNQTDWLGQINKPSLIQNYGISVSGGDDIALYRFSLAYAQNNGNIEDTNFKRLNVRFNSDIHLSKKLNIAADVAYAQTDHSVAADGINAINSPYYLALVKSPLYAPYQANQLTISDTDELNMGNPLSLVKGNTPALQKYRFTMNVRPTYAFTSNLKLAGTVGFSWDKENEDLFVPDFGVADQPLLNAQNEVYATALNTIRNSMARESSLSYDLHLDWNLIRNWRNELFLSAGNRLYSQTYSYTLGEGYNTGSDYMTGLSNTDGNLRTTYGRTYTDRNMAWYLSADYSYMKKYLVNLSMAMESSSRFGAKADGLRFCGVPWAFFPSLSGAWLISSEEFMQSIDFVNNLRLRLAYTVAGNDRLPVFANRSYFTSASFAQNATGLVLATIGNPNLKWETSSKKNIGLDFSLFNNRWTVNADWFYSSTKDLLTQKELPEEAGLRYYWSNEGELVNKGFEVATMVRMVDTPDWKLNVNASVGQYRNEVVSLDNGDYTTEVCNGQLLTAAGHPLGVFYGYQTEGVYSTKAEAESDHLVVVSPTGERLHFGAGDVRFKDVHQDGIIDDKDRVILGDPNPDFYGNASFSLQYKQFEWSAYFTYSYGNEAYNALRASLESGSSLNNQTKAMENRWIADGQQTSIPRAVYGDPMGNARFSDRWIEDASYVKFKRLQLTYRIPFQKNLLQQVSVWVAANNLFTFTHYLGADPEFSFRSSPLYQGIDGGYLPQSRSFQVGVNISL